MAALTDALTRAQLRRADELEVELAEEIIDAVRPSKWAKVNSGTKAHLSSDSSGSRGTGRDKLVKFRLISRPRRQLVSESWLRWATLGLPDRVPACLPRRAKHNHPLRSMTTKRWPSVSADSDVAQ